ncbi:hypothetical protein ACFL2U_03980 [Patescibacteria group bacterium]
MKKVKKAVVFILVICMLGISLPALGTEAGHRVKSSGKGNDNTALVVGVLGFFLFIGASYLHMQQAEQKSENNKPDEQQPE